MPIAALVSSGPFQHLIGMLVVDVVFEMLLHTKKLEVTSKDRLGKTPLDMIQGRCGVKQRLLMAYVVHRIRK